MKNNFFGTFEVFEKEGLGSVRTLTEEDGTIWFFSNDVTSILEYSNHSKAMADHTASDDRKALKYTATNDSLFAKLWVGNDRNPKIFINESGLYTLILGSHQEKAVVFKNWVTKEVLPSIRKHGVYVMGQERLTEEDREEFFNEALRLANLVEELTKKVEEKDKDLTEKSERVEKLTHSVESSDKFLELREKQIIQYEEKIKKLKADYEKQIQKLEEELYYAENPKAKKKPEETYVDRTTGLIYRKNFKKSESGSENE